MKSKKTQTYVSLIIHIYVPNKREWRPGRLNTSGSRIGPSNRSEVSKELTTAISPLSEFKHALLKPMFYINRTHRFIFLDELFLDVARDFVDERELAAKGNIMNDNHVPIHYEPYFNSFATLSIVML